MNIIIETIAKKIADQRVRFVFPSGIAADRWPRKICALGIARSVAANRFIAWDQFKEEVVREEVKESTPASSVIRKLFAETLVKKNAEAVNKTVEAGGEIRRGPSGFPLLSLIPPEYADRGSVFAASIASSLPSLAYWERLKKNATGCKNDGEDDDYALVKKEYAAFLIDKHLFEPSWEEIQAAPRDRTIRYIIFFPELIEDYAEYEGVLRPPFFVEIRVKDAELPHPPVIFYKSVREEVRSMILEIRRLHSDEGVPYTDMAVSVPGFEDMDAWLFREFSLFQVPVIRRSGKTLGESGAGQLFSLISKCAAGDFSFNSLKALILNQHIPWGAPEKNKALINFGIEYNCVSAYRNGGLVEDIWEEAFKGSLKAGQRELRSHYRTLKNAVKALSEAKTFADLRKQYFVFRKLLDMEKIEPEDNAVLSRCIDELGALIELEERFGNELAPASPLSFFISIIGEKKYLPKDQKPGVSVFDWRVAAAVPFACHFVLNASQSAAAVLYQPLKFLRQDKRWNLKLEDRDATGAFFLLCNTGAHEQYKPILRISASEQTYSGWAIPHSFFASKPGMISAPPQSSGDPYREERIWWGGGRQAGETFPGTIFKCQLEGFSTWRNALALKAGESFSFFTSPLPKGSSTADILYQKIWLKKSGPPLLPVSPTTDLNVFFDCSLFWVFQRIFSAEEYLLEAKLLDDESLGILYHNILEELFEKIKESDASFMSARLELYKKWAGEIADSCIAAHPAFSGPLAVPLVSSMAEGITKKIAALLDKEAERFDGYTVSELEVPVEKTIEYPDGSIRLNGRIDRVSVSPEGEPVIIDYKTSYIPKQTKADDIDREPLSEFQMPFYVKLYEEKLKAAG
jgi:hypothetical protein